jgi:2-oxoglutarate dehydrogenase E1 component
MYKIIRGKPKAMNEYADRLKSEGIFTEEDVLEIGGEIRRNFEISYTNAREHHGEDAADEFNTVTKWSALKMPHGDIYDTSIPADKLRSIATKVLTLPEDLNVHPVVSKNYENRLEDVMRGSEIDWATGEMLAWGSLLDEGINVRISGQDVERGTFSQRFASISD